MKVKVNKLQSGSVIVSILVVMIFITTVIYALLTLANSNVARAKSRLFTLESQYAAESGADSAVAILNNTNPNFTGTNGEVVVLTNGNNYKATYSSTVSAGSGSKQLIVTAHGFVYVPANASTPRFTRNIEVIAQRSGDGTTSSMLSRNILEVASGVKNIIGKNVFVNSYIDMAKNTTNLVAENITAAGKNTGAGNCSIGGKGNLVKPASFTTPGQTKTNITIGYNNCVNPPGNNSNANFNVLANQSNISTVQSIYIPWSQYMDSSYLNAGTCNDWTSGAFPREIPSHGNDKKTHYPDSGSGVSTSCGNNGSLDLASGQYDINNNTHIRASLCATNGCDITLNNPNNGLNGTTKTTEFIFVEGTVNFNSLQTAANSGPLVIVSYGADPAGLAGSCPYGGAFHLAKSGSNNTNAPAVYFIATNGGVCLDATKFGSSKSLGGVSGKNIYVATNPGTPFDLQLDPAFPTTDIPIDLAWRATRYRRL